MAIAIDRNLISARSARLDSARAALKAQFIGIDEIIDDLVDSLRIWYLMPEVLSRPVIINLWGMTGVGKTDLVRRLVKALEFQERFCEVELSNSDGTQYQTSVAAVLDANNINDDRPSIVLFDEIQRFNTLNPDGTAVQSTKFTDFWELLSDGRLAKRQRDDIDFSIRETAYAIRELKRRKEAGEEGVNPDESIGIWEAKNLKARLNLQDGLDDIALFTRTRVLELLREAQKSKRVFEPVNHSQTLVIVSGNLDDAFTMANLTSEADVDADIFHAFTKRITIIDVKGALARRFRPEQVARFGNIHLIYTSLRREHFVQLIAREIDRVVATTGRQFSITLTVTPAVGQLIYRNGVFPVQGVRPVFSSVIDILESNVSRLVFEAIMANHGHVHLDYSVERACLIGAVADSPMAGGVTVAGTPPALVTEVPYVGRLDKVRQRNVRDITANVSVHEAGHAAMYALLFGLAPLQLTSKVASSYAAGFTFSHEIHETRDQLAKKIQVFLAGGIAEDIVFGEGNATVGRAHDRELATQLCIDTVRRFGFDSEFQAHYGMDGLYAMDKTVTDSDIEKMIARLSASTHELLVQHQRLLLELAVALDREGKLDAEQVATIATRNGVIAATRPEGYLHLPGYAEAMANRRAKFD